MSITNEKLQIIKDNVSKVYRSGQMDVIKNANSLKGFESNKAILLDDISPVIHEMGVKVKNKNLLTYPYVETTLTRNGITFTDNGDGTITANGTATADAQFKLQDTVVYPDNYNPFVNLINQKITVTGSPDGSSKDTYGIQHIYVGIVGNGGYTITNKNYYRYAILIKSGITVENLVFKPQIELGSTATAYTPYVLDLTAVKVSRYGKNLTNSLTDINAEQNSSVISRDNGIVTLESKNVITYSSMAHLYDRILSAGTYTFSFDCTIENIKKCTKPNYVHLYVDDKFVANVIYDMNKDGTYHRSFNFKITKKSRVLIRFYFNIDSITEASDTIITKAMFSNVQLELGSTATDYEPYITPTDYTPNTDGTVNGITSLYPNTTLTTDIEGVLIDCEYYKDVDKAYNKLSAAIALSGGE